MPIGDLLAQISGDPSPTEPTYNSRLPPPKRISDDQVRLPQSKIQRTGPRPNVSSKSATPNARSAPLDQSLAKVKLGQTPKGGTSSTATINNGRPTPPPAIDTAPKALKKGSFAEIMARAKVGQKNMEGKEVGKIQHKKIEKPLSKREKEGMMARKGANIAKNLAPGGKFNKAPLNGVARVGSKNTKAGIKKGPPEPEKKIKKAATATTGYAGTARPKPSGSKPASRPTPSASSSRYGSGLDRDRYGSTARYAYFSDEEEEEEDEQEDYESDVSSDMEAAAFEVDDEEEQAARIARKEDAEALAEENRLKREKEERRKRLAAMAKSRR